MILAFYVAAREFASMAVGCFLAASVTSARAVACKPCMAGRPPLPAPQAGRAQQQRPGRQGPTLCRPTVRLAELMLSLPTCIAQALACVGCQQDADGAIVNVVATISMQAAVVACGRQGSTRFSANYIHKRWLAPGVTTVPYVAEHRLTTALPMPRTGSSSSQFGTECLRRLQAG